MLTRLFMPKPFLENLIRLSCRPVVSVRVHATEIRQHQTAAFMRETRAKVGLSCTVTTVDAAVRSTSCPASYFLRSASTRAAITNAFKEPHLPHS